MKKLTFTLCLCLCCSILFGQGYPTDPFKAEFVTEDLPRFWAAFDALETAEGNPFEAYIEDGTPGLQGFIDDRIISAEALLEMVQNRKKEYTNFRDIEQKIKTKIKETKPYFYGLKYWYPDAVFPPTYFVMGRFNSGGTSKDAGVIIGAEMQKDLDKLPSLVIHESIHYQQNYVPKSENYNLLEQSIKEGAADFLAELLTGSHINAAAHEYGEANRTNLCIEFVSKMYQDDFQDWLYGTSGKDNRPNDLGYWIGYRIVKSYFDKAPDKKKAVYEIMNIYDFDAFLEASGFLSIYLDAYED
jgi:hypothetical protein